MFSYFSHYYNSIKEKYAHYWRGCADIRQGIDFQLSFQVNNRYKSVVVL